MEPGRRMGGKEKKMGGGGGGPWPQPVSPQIHMCCREISLMLKLINYYIV
jgi:hypothetical protein